MQNLTDAVDEIVTIGDFLAVSEAHVLEDVTQCVQALQNKELDSLDRTAGAIQGTIFLDSKYSSKRLIFLTFLNKKFSTKYFKLKKRKHCRKVSNPKDKFKILFSRSCSTCSSSRYG